MSSKVNKNTNIKSQKETSKIVKDKSVEITKENKQTINITQINGTKTPSDKVNAAPFQKKEALSPRHFLISHARELCEKCLNIINSSDFKKNMSEFNFNPKITKYLNEKYPIQMILNSSSKRSNSVSPDLVENSEDITKIEFMNLHSQNLILKNGLNILNKNETSAAIERLKLSISSKLQSRKISPEKALIFDFYKDTKLMSKLANDFSIEMPNFKSRSKLIDENAHKENLKRILEMKRNLKSKKDLIINKKFELAQKEIMEKQQSSKLKEEIEAKEKEERKKALEILIQQRSEQRKIWKKESDKELLKLKIHSPLYIKYKEKDEKFKKDEQKI